MKVTIYTLARKIRQWQHNHPIYDVRGVPHRKSLNADPLRSESLKLSLESIEAMRDIIQCAEELCVAKGVLPVPEEGSYTDTDEEIYEADATE